MDILISECTQCHHGGNQPNLEEDSCASIVNIPSYQVTNMNLVTPYEPENSYLLHKMKGTAGTVDGVDSIMPISGVLPEEDIAIIEEWITNGAACDEDVEEEHPEGSVTNGETIHDQICWVCHSTIGNFPEVIPDLTDENIQNIVNNGMGAMPQQNLTEEEVRDLIAFLREEYPTPSEQ